MGELARKRSARDLWVSRSHLWAMGTGTLVLAATAFVVGFTVGRDHAPVQVIDAASTAGEEPQLVELLARVEASSRPHGGVDELTFPEALQEVPTAPVAPEEGIAAEPVAIPAPEQAELVATVPGGPPPLLLGDDVPNGAVTIEVARFDQAAPALVLRERLNAARLPAWVAVEIIDGRSVHRVSVGGYADDSAGAVALAQVAPMVHTLGIASAPVVVPIH